LSMIACTHNTINTDHLSKNNPLNHTKYLYITLLLLLKCIRTHEMTVLNTLKLCLYLVALACFTLTSTASSYDCHYGECQCHSHPISLSL
jgi:hypothetical protein